MERISNKLIADHFDDVFPLGLAPKFYSAFSYKRGLPAEKMAIGNIGIGNTFTMATIEHRPRFAVEAEVREDFVDAISRQLGTIRS